VGQARLESRTDLYRRDLNHQRLLLANLFLCQVRRLEHHLRLHRPVQTRHRPSLRRQHPYASHLKQSPRCKQGWPCWDGFSHQRHQRYHLRQPPKLQNVSPMKRSASQRGLMCPPLAPCQVDCSPGTRYLLKSKDIGANGIRGRQTEILQLPHQMNITRPHVDTVEPLYQFLQ